MVVAVIWAVNPTLGGCDDQEFSFGEAEMLALLDTLNAETWTEAEAEIYFELSQATEGHAALRLPSSSFMGSAWACGDRSFAAEAAACIESSTLPVEGSVTVIDTASGVNTSAIVSGEIMVFGYDLDNAEVYLVHDGGDFLLSSDDGVTFTLDGASW